MTGWWGRLHVELWSVVENPRSLLLPQPGVQNFASRWVGSQSAVSGWGLCWVPVLIVADWLHCEPVIVRFMHMQWCRRDRKVRKGHSVRCCEVQ